MRKCSIEGCNNKHRRKGYCRKHYRNLVFYPQNKDRLSQYNKDRRIKLGLIKIHKCEVIECNKKIKLSSRFCYFHNLRFLKYGNPVEPSHWNQGGAKGENNVNWHGGTSEYPNHHEMKIARKKKLKQVDNKCEICKKKKKLLHIHHIDGTKTNHTLDNLVVVCPKCHINNFHKKQKRKSKYTEMFGVNISKLLRITKCNYSDLRNVFSKF